MERFGTNRLTGSQESIGGERGQAAMQTTRLRFLPVKEEGHSRNDGKGEIPAERENNEDLGEKVKNGGGIWLTLHGQREEHQAPWNRALPRHCSGKCPESFLS